MKKRALLPFLTFAVWCIPVAGTAQNALPTSQPMVLTVFREEVKYGHSAEHEVVEAGWPAAYAKAKSPNTYIAITSLTGANEAWFLSPYANYQAMGDAMKFDTGNPALAAELTRLSRADAEHVNSGRALHLMGRPDLSGGTFPSVAKIRFYEISIYRVRPGHEQEFDQVAKMFGAAYKKVAPEASFRVYQVVAGLPGPTYMVFSSVQSLGELDKMQATDMAAMGTFTPEQIQTMQKFATDGMINVETQRFAVNGRMSYVDDATANQDLAFWRPGVKASK